jgi:predicted DNA-binding protein with PD1-like motif
MIPFFLDHPQQLGEKMELLSVLHNWEQNRFFSPHLHVIVPAEELPKMRSGKQ